MKLRNGKIYEFKIKKDKEKKEKKDKFSTIDEEDLKYYENCIICFEKYKSNDKIISCDLENMKKHNYHEKCFNKCIKYNKYFTACPFCMKPMFNEDTFSYEYWIIKYP